MSTTIMSSLSHANRKNAKSKALAVLAILAMSATPSFAYTDGPMGGPRAFRGEMIGPNPYCAPANGAEVLGGFAAPRQWVDTRTGFACGRW